MKLLSIGLIGTSLPSALAFIGFGIEMYHPSCAFACRGAIASAPLACTDGHAHGHSSHHGGPTTPECRAGDTPFLTTLAYCINSTCTPEHVEIWKLEEYWRKRTTGDIKVPAKWSYGQALAKVEGVPTRHIEAEETLNFTAAVSREDWEAAKKAQDFFEWQEDTHSRYGIALLVTSFGIPIVFTWLGYLPYMSGLLDKAKPYLVYPSLIGTYQVRPLPYLLGNAPTLGQALYIGFFFLLNLIFACATYQSANPSIWFDSRYQEIAAYVSNRTGVLAFCLAPLVILFSGRNNILLWLTNWSHSTFMLLHRWVARIFTVHCIVHSVVELALYTNNGGYKTELVEKYWIWGCVATVAASVMLVQSVLFFRRFSYEAFLILHILLAVFLLVGCWYHVELRFERKWGYELWLYAACGVWFFDRLLRFLRIVKVGIRRSTVTEICDDTVRIDVHDVRWSAEPGYYAYAYFPSLSPLRPWENHPFSIVPTVQLVPRITARGDASSRRASSDGEDVEKSQQVTAREVRQKLNTVAGVSFYIKKSTGVTKFLQKHDQLLTLLDGPYRGHPVKPVLNCDRIVLIGGGIGITGVLPFIDHHANVKLFWGLKDRARNLAADLENVLDRLDEKEVRIGNRLDVNALLTQEVGTGWKRIGVVVCGPGGLCDDVRAAIARLGREGKAVFELEVAAFSW